MLLFLVNVTVLPVVSVVFCVGAVVPGRLTHSGLLEEIVEFFLSSGSGSHLEGRAGRAPRGDLSTARGKLVAGGKCGCESVWTVPMREAVAWTRCVREVACAQE